MGGQAELSSLPISSSNHPYTMRDVTSFLKNQIAQSTGTVQQYWIEMETLYDKKLWHQLTIKLLEFVKLDACSKGTGLVDLYENFLIDFEHRINQLTLVEITLFVVRQMQEAGSALEFT